MNGAAGIERRNRRRWILACAACLLPLPSAAAAPAAKKTVRPAERAWIQRSAVLVKAVKAHANVAEFRRDVRGHQESLRAIVRANPNPPPPVLQLHRSMILMFALLNAASECHSGGRLACPEDLMQQLEEQVRTGFAQVNSLDRGTG